MERDARSYFRWLIDKGGLERYGTPDWKTPERAARIDHELGVIEGQEYSATFCMLADVMAMCRREHIVYGPGRGSVGGCYTGYLAGIHEIDSIAWGLFFERFLNSERVTFPDVDIDISQRNRGRVIDYIVDTYDRDDQVVLRVAAFVRAGGRAVVDAMLAARSHLDPEAGATATNLKKCFPDKGNLTMGVKVQRELEWWLENGHGDRDRFRQIAEQAGWLDPLLKMDGMLTHLGQHAAGVVILRQEDLPNIPLVHKRIKDTDPPEYMALTGYDMYSLDDLAYLKWDFLGLRTLDVIADAHRFIGGSGDTRDLMQLWADHRHEPEPYRLIADADATGLFQVDTPGYKRTLRDFVPENFDHLVQLVALYRPGALDFKDRHGRNMVEVFIERRHGREYPSYGDDDRVLQPVLAETHGIMVYQEQQMSVARTLAGFTLAQADLLRRAIGKKKPKEMAKLLPIWNEGTAHIAPAVRDRWWKNIDAASRYSWNKSHAVFYAVILWLTAYFKAVHPAAFYAAEINSWEDKKDRQANVVAEARQHAGFSPPDVNIAEDRFIVSGNQIVFGLNGIKGMGDSYRNALLLDRLMGGPYQSYANFCARVKGTVPVQIKRALIACGAFDSLGESRARLLATVPTPTPQNPGKRKPYYQFVEDNLPHKRKRPLPEPSLLDFDFPSDVDLAAGEMDAMGYYISAVPLKAVTQDLARLPTNTIGGEVTTMKIHIDRRGDEMCTLTLTTPALTRQTVRIFASNWGVWGHRVTRGQQLMFRGHEDGDIFLADACWAAGDYRHFRKIRLSLNGEKKVVDFDGRVETVRDWESQGYTVRLL